MSSNWKISCFISRRGKNIAKLKGKISFCRGNGSQDDEKIYNDNLVYTFTGKNWESKSNEFKQILENFLVGNKIGFNSSDDDCLII